METKKCGLFIFGITLSWFFNILIIRFSPDCLVQEGVVVVTINYRLGPLGFLSMPKAGISGNAGLKDQLLALKFVNQHIENFCGDPTNVTLFGESAGASSVHMHYMSKKSRLLSD